MGTSIAGKIARNMGAWLLAHSGTQVRDPALVGDPLFVEMHLKCSPYSMTSKERMYALYAACMYVLDTKLEGAFVECGVWKGGSAMMIAACLKSKGVLDRDIYLYDTYEGMSKPEERIHLIKGKVEESLPARIPAGPIALLRLDTDWYSSTKQELTHLYPMLVKRGVLIIDDFGHWEGARKAVMEYFDQHSVNMLLNRIDYTGRIGVKVDGPSL